MKKYSKKESMKMKMIDKEKEIIYIKKVFQILN